MIRIDEMYDDALDAYRGMLIRENRDLVCTLCVCVLAMGQKYIF